VQEREKFGREDEKMTTKLIQNEMDLSLEIITTKEKKYFFLILFVA